MGQFSEQLVSEGVILRVAAVIPCFRVSDHILKVIESIGSEVETIYVVDDACPEQSGKKVQAQSKDKRVKVIFNEKNLGVGGAVTAGYAVALKDGFDIVVKIDGDGQMDASLIPRLIGPILHGVADYTKGNRFETLESLEQMPRVRIFGNAALSLFSKLSSGYWNITDPTNGFTAIHRSILEQLPLDKVNRGFFFESDMLFRLSVMRAVVWDVPMPARYGSEKSNLKIRRVLWEFPRRHFVNLNKRIFYSYYLRELNIASFELPISVILMGFGLFTGITRLVASSESGVPATAGTVMLAAVPLILGFQMFLAFLGYDIASVPNRPRQSFDKYWRK